MFIQICQGLNLFKQMRKHYCASNFCKVYIIGSFVCKRQRHLQAKLMVIQIIRRERAKRACAREERAKNLWNKFYFLISYIIGSFVCKRRRHLQAKLMVIQTVMLDFIKGFAQANLHCELARNATSLSLYYRKFCLQAPKAFASKTDGYSNYKKRASEASMCAWRTRQKFMK